MLLMPATHDHATIAIRRRMKDVGLTQTEFAKRIGRVQGWVSGRLFVDPDATLRHLAYKEPDVLARILSSLGWSIHQLNAATRLSIPIAPEEATGEALDRWAVNPTFEVFPVFHSVSAGTEDGEPIDEHEAAIPLEHMKKRGATREDTMVVLVNGDCMVSKSIWETRSIRHHDYIAIHLGANAKANDIVVCYDAKEEQLIVKRFGEDDDNYILLYPSNGHPPIVRPKEDPELVYRGVVYWRGGNI